MILMPARRSLATLLAELSAIVTRAQPGTALSQRGALLLGICFALAGAPSAGAATTVTGDRDTSAPLEITPSSDPLVADVNLQGREVAFIQRMPVTKIVERITLGDLARADRCTGNVSVELEIWEHPAGNLTGEGGELVTAPQLVTFDAELAKRTWTIPPTALRAGRGYSFRLTAHPVPCGYAKQRTWAHNAPQVNGGTVTCANEPLIGENGAANRRWRMWHAQGADDRHPSCVNSTSQEHFHPSMPGGWLATVSYNGTTRKVAQHTHYADSPGPHSQCGDEQRFGQIGAIEEFWRNKPNWTPTAEQYVCTFNSQYGPPGVELPDGWYYGLPWREERDGAPRDVYLRLDTTASTYAGLFRPSLHFDSGEAWRPLSVDLFASEVNDQGQRLHEICSSTGLCQPLDGPSAFHLGSYLDIAGSGDADNYHSPYDSCTTGEMRDCDSGPRSAMYYWHTPAQPGAGGYTGYFDYWVFYRYNDWPGLIGGDHEGDWESITLGQSSLNPAMFAFASFSQHGHWYSYLRENLSCGGGGPGSCGTGASPIAARLDVFVARGSHANYPAPCDPGGIDPTPCDVRTDHPGPPRLTEAPHDGEVPWGNNSDPSALIPLEDPREVAMRWASWPGNWGAPSEQAPNGPGHGGNQAHFEAPWSSECARDNDGCPREFVGPSSLDRARAATTRGNDRCAAWFGAGVMAAACTPPRLRAALVRKWLPRRGALSFSLGARSSRRGWRGTGSATGVAQAVGQPLRPGQQLWLRGHANARTQLLVRAATATRLIEAQFRDVTLRRGDKVKVVARRRNGVPTLRLVGQNRRIGKPSAVRRARFGIAGRPNLRRAFRRGRELHLTYSGPGAYTHLEVSAKRHSPAVSERVTKTREGLTRATVHVPRHGRYVRLTALALSGARSATLVAPIPRGRD